MAQISNKKYQELCNFKNNMQLEWNGHCVPFASSVALAPAKEHTQHSWSEQELLQVNYLVTAVPLSEKGTVIFSLFL